MANPKDVLQGAHIGVNRQKDNPAGKDAIHELISRAFTTRNLTHFAHWATNSYSEHMALGDLYDEIENAIDSVVEAYQGKFGIINGTYTEAAVLPADILKRIKCEAEWISDNKQKISGGCDGVIALLDELEACYLKAIYKVTNLK